VLKAVKPVRKRAGKVRDMDVLTGFASTLSSDSNNGNECLVQLLEHLGHRRFQDSRKLHRAAVQQRSVASRSLKRCSSWIKGNLNGKLGKNEWPLDAAAMALQLSAELARWPKLTAQTLHPFRLKVKELRYVLQLSGKRDNLVENLGEVKDKIGEWHDWAELAAIAEDVVQHAGQCDVLEQIRSGARLRFREAMTVANHLRQQYFEEPAAKSRRAASTTQAKPTVLKAAAKLAA
jgi:CHAD domain-containing protein